MALQFAIDPDKGETFQDAEQKRKDARMMITAALARTPRNVGEGLSAIGKALIARQMNQEASAAAQANAATSSSLMQDLLGLTPFPGAPGAGGASGGGVAGDAASERVSKSFAPLGESQESFVSGLMPAAVEASKRTGVDPRIIVAQAAQETGWGKHAPGNNYFGIKSHGQGGGQNLATTEYINGKPVRVSDSFRGYASPADSVKGYADFLLENPRYKPMMAAQGLDAQLAALGASGYATDPNYANSVGAIARSLPVPAAQAAEAMAMGQPVPPAPTQVASLDPSIGMIQPAAPSTVNPQQAGQPVATDPKTQRIMGQMMNPQPMGGTPMSLGAPQPVAQAAPPGVDLDRLPVTAGGNAGVYNPQQAARAAIAKALSNPSASPTVKRIAALMLERQMKQQDPAAQLDMSYKQAQLDNLLNPTKAPTVQQFYDPQSGQPYQAQWNPKTRSWDKVGGNKAPSNGWQITTNPDGTTSISMGGGKPLTEGQSKDTTFFTRGSGALPVLDKYGSALTSLPEKAAGNAPIVGNYLKSKEYQQAEQAGLEFLQAILRKDTGAAITPAETAEYGKVYLPQPGDSAEVLAQKKAARHRALAAIKIGLPATAILGMENAGVDLGQGDLPPSAASGDQPVKIDREQDYLALPRGAQYVAPDGTVRRKP